MAKIAGLSKTDRARKYYFKDSGIPFAVVRIPSQVPMRRHIHEFNEIVIITDGKGVHFTKNLEYTVNAGDVFLIPPGLFHGYKDTKSLELVNVLYWPDRLEMPLNDLLELRGYHAFFSIEPGMRKLVDSRARLHMGPDVLSQLLRIVTDLETELESGRPGRRFLCTAYFMELTGLVSREYTNTKDPVFDRINRLGEVLAYMQKNYMEKISLEQLGHIARTSLSSLNRAFKESLGITPIDHLISLRIAKSKILLKERRLSVTDIAFQTGFNDSNYFIRQFKKLTGMTPKKFQKNP